MHNTDFKTVQRWYIKGWIVYYIEAGRVPHTDYVCFEAVSKSNRLMKIDRN